MKAPVPVQNEGNAANAPRPKDPQKQPIFWKKSAFKREKEEKMQKILVIREKNSVKTFDYTFQTRTFFSVCGYGYTIKLSGGSIVVCDGDGN